MNFTSQICTSYEQSERLLALGIKRETADMVILEHPRKEGRYFYIAKEDANWDGFPAWSLHRLIELLPPGYREQIRVGTTDNPYDYMYQVIGRLIYVSEFNKEYLE